MKRNAIVGREESEDSSIPQTKLRSVVIDLNYCDWFKTQYISYAGKINTESDIIGFVSLLLLQIIKTNLRRNTITGKTKIPNQ